MKLCGRGCGSKIRDDARCCDECRTERNSAPEHADEGRQHNTYDAELDSQRKSPRWQRRRAEAIKKCPICARCGVARSEIVDHIIPAQIAVIQARDSGRWPFDTWTGYYLLTNLQGLCRRCHALKTVEDKLHTGVWPSVLEAYDKAPKKVWSF